MKHNRTLALLDLYAGTPNEGLRGIRQSVESFAVRHGFEWDIRCFDVRGRQELPDTTYDVYISSGGPGDPTGLDNPAWEQRYFEWLQQLCNHNETWPEQARPVLFICHSFQMACRFFGVGEVIKRKSRAFGIYPVHLTPEGTGDPLFRGLPDIFQAVDSREYQVIRPVSQEADHSRGRLLALEKVRPHVPLERAVMAYRFNTHMAGTQFHPEADASGMRRYLNTDDVRLQLLPVLGEEKWTALSQRLEQADDLRLTEETIIPNFLSDALSLNAANAAS